MLFRSPSAGVALAAAGTLSSLSAHHEANCTRLAEAGGIAILMGRMGSEDVQIVGRATAVLGNMAAVNDQLRIKVGTRFASI